MKRWSIFFLVLLIGLFGITAIRAEEKNNNDEQIFHTKCSVCHSDEIPLHMNKDRKAWEQTVKRMQQKRPNFISDKDAQKIIDFLVTNSKKEK